MKYSLARFLCVALAAGFLCILGSDSRPQITRAPEKPVPVIQFAMTASNASSADIELIEQKLNAYIVPLIGASVEITLVSNTFYTQTLSQILSSNDGPDVIFCPSYSVLKEWKEQGWVRPLEDLLQASGREILQAVPTQYLHNGEIDGNIYGLPSARDMAGSIGLEYSKELARKYDIDLSGVKTFSDLTALFEQVKEKCPPEIIPVALVDYATWDKLDNNYGVLMDYENSAEVVNLYETDTFEQKVRQAYEWRQQGYVLDTISNSGDNFFYFHSGEIFSSFANGKPGFETQESRTLGREMGFIELYPAFACTSNLNMCLFAVSQSTQHPQQAMAFLNLMYSDPVVENLLIYGIEGLHYVFKDRENGVITFPEGVDAQTSGYAQFLGWRHCNQFISHVWDGDDPDIWRQIQDFNNTAVKSIAYGFRFDGNAVQSEIIRCNKVCDQYLSGLKNGFLNPDEVLAQFRQELRDAGIQAIINEKQKQLDRWLVQKNS